MDNDFEGGLDLTQPDTMSEPDRAKFESFYLEHKGATLPGHDFWMEHDPGAMKRYRWRNCSGFSCCSGS